MINNLLKFVLCSCFTIGVIDHNKASSMQNRQQDEDVITKNIQQDKGSIEKYTIDAQNILGDSLQLLYDSKTALVQVTTDLNNVIKQGKQLDSIAV